MALGAGLAAAAGLSRGQTRLDEPRGPEAPEVGWVVAPPPAGWGALDPGPPAPVPAVVGQAPFLRHCAGCHGVTGRGDGPLASSLPRPPRDLAGEPLRTRSAPGAPSREDVFRTITVGAPAHGMPAFDHLPAGVRWALAAFVVDLARDMAAPAAPLQLPARPAQVDLEHGRALFMARCATCHGLDAAGDGPLAAGLTDARGRPNPPADLRRGAEAFRGGARAEDIARTVLLGRPGSAMAPLALDARELWAVASWLAARAERGHAARREAWDGFFRARRERSRDPSATPGRHVDRWDPEVRELAQVAPDGGVGCLACHEGIEPVAEGAMAHAIDAFAGGQPDRACVVCHEGNAAASRADEAHAGLIGNPGSLWVTSVGAGCGKCHAEPGALGSLLGQPFPEPMGGALMSVRSRVSDPTGASGANHAYRMQRALMAQETGKVWLATASAGLVERDRPRFTALPVDDPDGPVPCAGNDTYRAFMARAIEVGAVLRLERGEGLPTYAQALALLGDEGAAAYLDVYRKDCARCHLWGEGKPARGERRSAGCSACHVLNDLDQRYEGEDPTIPTHLPGHPLRHAITTKIPESQCNHCHTRGQETLHSDAHQVAGIGCVDCHTSIDVHGDGNIYPTIRHQLEIRCEDCHGSERAAPWDLPLGVGTKAEAPGPRGTLRAGEREHVVTSRGNARTNWVRVGDDVVVTSRLTGKRHVTPPLWRRGPGQAQGAGERGQGAGGHTFGAGAGGQGAGAASPHLDPIPAHEALACAACHNRSSPRCGACHIEYFRQDAQTDWLLGAQDYDPRSTRQRERLTPGVIEFRSPGGPGWDEPDFRKGDDGRTAPQIPGCRPSLTVIGERGERREFTPRMNPGSKDYPPPVAPHLPHEKALPARSCSACHVDGKGGPAVFPRPRDG